MIGRHCIRPTHAGSNPAFGSNIIWNMAVMAELVDAFQAVRFCMASQSALVNLFAVWPMWVRIPLTAQNFKIVNKKER